MEKQEENKLLNVLNSIEQSVSEEKREKSIYNAVSLAMTRDKNYKCSCGNSAF